MGNIKTYPTDDDRLLAAEDDVWVHGVFDDEATVREFVKLTIDQQYTLWDIQLQQPDPSDRFISMSDINWFRSVYA